MNNLISAIEKANSIAISGHLHPDGDCVGSTTAIYFYIQENFPEKELYYFLDPIPTSIANVINAPERINAEEFDKSVDLFISLDSSSLDRLGDAIGVFEKAKYKFVIDHHKTNTNFGDALVCEPDASSACEVLFKLLDYSKISERCAKSLFLGIVHDTGVFKYSATSKSTMEAAGMLLDKGINAADIIDRSFYEKSYNQNMLLARGLSNAKLAHDGMIIYTVITLKDLEEFGCNSSETDGIVEQLRLTRGVEIAMFIREDAKDVYKFSLRSKNGLVDVSEISFINGGGGHSRAAGFTMNCPIDEAVSRVLSLIEERL